MDAPPTRYVALGDSTTEGLEDPDPRGGGYLGFADRLAARLARENPGLLYANLAIRGRKMPQIRAEQLEPALAMEPDLASIVGGLNDILRPRVDIDSILADLEAMVTPLREGGATVLGMTYPDASAILRPARAAMPRVLAFNEGVRELGRRTGMLVVDFGERGVVDPRLWDADRLHANPEGHARIADAMGEALGLEWEADPWAPLDPLPGVPRAVAARAEAVWMVRHMAPWVLRRIRRRSSGDGIEPKRPVLAPVELA